MSEIWEVTGREIPGVGGELKVALTSGVVGVAVVSGIDAEMIAQLSAALRGQEVIDQRAIDDRIIALGVINRGFDPEIQFGVSLAVAHAAARELALPPVRYLGGLRSAELPLPLLKLVSGREVGMAFRQLDLLPQGFATFNEAWQALQAVAARFGRRFARRLPPPGVSVFAEVVADLELAARETGFPLGEQLYLALDCDAGSFYCNGIYDYAYAETPGVRLDRDDQIAYVEVLTRDYPIAWVIDPLMEGDFSGFAELTRRVGCRTVVAGRRLYAAGAENIRRGAACDSTAAVIVDPSYVSTLSEFFTAVAAAQESGQRIGVVAPPGAEYAAELAVSVNAEVIGGAGYARLVAAEKSGR